MIIAIVAICAIVAPIIPFFAIIAIVEIIAIIAIMAIICTKLSTLIHVMWKHGWKSQNFRSASHAVTAVLTPASTTRILSKVGINP